SPCLFALHAPAPTATSTLSLHDALPISHVHPAGRRGSGATFLATGGDGRAERPVGPLDGHERRFRDRDRARCDACPGRLCHLRRSEEHTSELQSRENLVCRLLLEKKKVV